MIDNLGGIDCVNNFLVVFNMKFVNVKNFKVMERRVGYFVEKVLKMLIDKVVKEFF